MDQVLRKEDIQCAGCWKKRSPLQSASSGTPMSYVCVSICSGYVSSSSLLSVMQPCTQNHLISLSNWQPYQAA